MARKKIKAQVEIDLSIVNGAAWFAELNDDEQAQFFVHVAAIAAETYEGSPESQWIRIGDHLATCKCSSEQGRELIRSIHYGMEHPWARPNEPETVDLMAKTQDSNTAVSAGTT